jgi:hypothetical protein
MPLTPVVNHTTPSISGENTLKQITSSLIVCHSWVQLKPNSTKPELQYNVICAAPGLWLEAVLNPSQEEDRDHALEVRAAQNLTPQDPDKVQFVLRDKLQLMRRLADYNLANRRSRDDPLECAQRCNPSECLNQFNQELFDLCERLLLKMQQ